MRYIKEFLIAVLIVAVFWAVFDGQLQRKKVSEYDAKEQRLKASLDSLKALQHQADLHAINALTDLEVARGQLREQSKVTEKFKLRYEALKKTRVPMLTDRAIDSLVSVLYPIR